MKSRKLVLKLTNEQYKKVSQFVCKKKTELNIDKGWGLISQPKIMSEKLDIIFLTKKECGVLIKIFRKLKLIK